MDSIDTDKYGDNHKRRNMGFRPMAIRQRNSPLPTISFGNDVRHQGQGRSAIQRYTATVLPEHSVLFSEPALSVFCMCRTSFGSDCK